MSARVVLHLDPDLARELDEFVAAEPGGNRSTVVRKALSEFLRRRTRPPAEDDEIDEVDLELARIAKRRLEDPDDEVIPWEQAKAELGL